MLPLIVEADFTSVLATITPMYAGMLAGGLDRLPGSVLHVPPAFGGFALVQFAKPRKLAFAFGPLMKLLFSHCAPQNITELPLIAPRSPITKAPVPTNVYTI